MLDPKKMIDGNLRSLYNMGQSHMVHAFVWEVAAGKASYPDHKPREAAWLCLNVPQASAVLYRLVRGCCVSQKI